MSIPVHLPVPSQHEPMSGHSERTVAESIVSSSDSPLLPQPYTVSRSPRLSSRSQGVVSPVLPGILDPELQLNARSVRLEFLRRDVIFAKLIVSILAQRIELGILSPSIGVGFPFTDKEDRKKSSMRPSGWDTELGFNAHSYRERYPNVLALVHHDLELRGFIVDKLGIEPDENGIYITYSLALPEP